MKTLAPREARRFHQIVRLPRDNIGFKEHWFMLDESRITIARQRGGEKSEWMVDIPRRVFNQMVDWYNTGSTRRPK